jgi:hypothetical protein
MDWIAFFLIEITKKITTSKQLSVYEKYLEKIRKKLFSVLIDFKELSETANDKFS